VISDEKTWIEIWRSLSTDPAPTVDFRLWRVAAVFLGHRPTNAYRVEIDANPRISASEAVLGYREIAPEPGRTPPEGATAPYAMRLIPKSDLPVRFVKRS
jgi:hypothetical protein